MKSADIHIVLGQSNGYGNFTPNAGDIDEAGYFEAWALKEGEISLTPSDVDFHRSGDGAPWWDFSRVWTDLTGKETIWVNCVRGGAPLLKSVDGVYYWEDVDSGSLWQTRAKPWINDTLAAIAQSPRFNITNIYVHWVQGESDGTAISDPAAYQAALEAMIDTVCTAYPVTKFCVYGLGFLTDDQSNASYTAIRGAQVAAVAAKEKAVMVFDKAHTGTVLVKDGAKRWVSGFSYADTKHWSPEASAVAGVEGAHALYSG